MVWSLNVEATFPISSRFLFFFLTPYQLYACTVLEAESRGASICGQSCYLRTSILYKGSLYVKQKHFCFAFQLGWAGRIDLFFLQSEKTKPRDYQNVGSVYQFQVEIKHSVDTQRSIFPWLKRSCPLNCYTGYRSVGLAHSHGCNKSQQLGTSPNKTQTLLKSWAFPWQHHSHQHSKQLLQSPLPVPLSNSKGYHCSQPPRTGLIILHERR